MASPISVLGKKNKTRLGIPHRSRDFSLPYIYDFSEGNREMKIVLGGKGAALAEMTRLGLPVPPGFTITTQTCRSFLEQGGYPPRFEHEFEEQMRRLEKNTGKIFGGEKNPLLVSVRSGAAVSMPGMMDTVLNLGLCEKTLAGLIEKTKNERFCWDAYRRFINMFGEVVLGVRHADFEAILEGIKHKKGIREDTGLDVADLQKLVAAYKNLIEQKTGKVFPEDPREQLKLAIVAVFDSWNNDRAKTYRKIHNITGLYGTAVNIQSMVFGNMGETSGTGVVFTRNPSTGEKEFYGEFLMNAQGEDVVAGIRTPRKIDELKNIIPKAYNELLTIQKTLEQHYKNMQDIEFTIEEGQLFILQCRSGKRSAVAAIKIALDMEDEGLITQEEAILQVDARQMIQLLHPNISAGAKKNIVAKGLPASPGAACGKVVFTPEDACKMSENSEKVILVRKETSPEDIQGMFVAQGIVTALGGMTSHAAVVCRGMGKPCVAGCSQIEIDSKEFRCGSIIIKEGDVITIDGSTGEIMLGKIALEEPKMSDGFEKFMGWVDKFRRLKIRANADTPSDATIARKFGAEGIGLCRTEHMFFAPDRVGKMREMIVASDETGRKQALAKLLPLQREDFIGILRAMNGLPVTIRLLDPPLHEFLPTTQEQVDALAKTTGKSSEEIRRHIDHLHEINPMLGHRGCRLAVTYPEIYAMQAQAILEAAVQATKEGIAAHPEIEIPLIGSAEELKLMRDLVEGVARNFGQLDFIFKIGTMIELPRACVTADAIAAYADFFSFGTNDLTQMTFGFSRDDAGKFLPQYLEKGIIERDPTETIDQKGVGGLMKICVELGRSVKPELEIGICGEHGGEPKSVEFCHQIGLSFVSCSPYRVPIARLAAAQAAISDKQP